VIMQVSRRFHQDTENYREREWTGAFVGTFEGLIGSYWGFG